MRNIVIIVAGGKGKRMGKPKQFLKIAGKPMLAWTVAAFQKCHAIDGIILVVAKEQMTLAKRIKAAKLIAVVSGGEERQDSVRNGLVALPASTEIVAIHDGARPGLSVETIERSIKEAKNYGAVVVGVPVKDTIKVVSRQSLVVSQTADRSNLWAAQTPQTFQLEIIRKAYDRLIENVTDDAMAVEKLGIPVRMVMGEYTNIKVTTPEDLTIMKSILKGKG
jgi:2-C-methyl-D-erythritol 4-phosphate cytidylyltransferase